MDTPSPRFAVVGAGRLGTALHRALGAAGLPVAAPPLRRGEPVPAAADVVFLCVPDRVITTAASSVAGGPLVVHCSGATSVDVLLPHARRGVFHPLLSVPDGATPLNGAFVALRAGEPTDLALLRNVADRLGLTPVEVAEPNRAAYHAAATLASNAVVALQSAVADLAATAGVPREAFGPLSRAALDQALDGGDAALTGPAARGDWTTVAAQRAAVAERTPQLLELFDAVTTACARIAGTGPVPARLRPAEHVETSREGVSTGSTSREGVSPGSTSRHALTLARTRAELADAVAAARRNGATVGFVPTMGALHRGHSALIAEAAQAHEAVVVSIFVNPTQFNDAADLANYPRTEAADLEVAAAAGATIAFLPGVDVMYPPGFATTVGPGPIAQLLEGEHRPGHFDGVATVVARLLGLAGADAAYFGRKDAQQLAIVEQVVRDLAIPTRIVGVDTVRDADGLALSSRNTRLSQADRGRALALSRGLRRAEARAAAGVREADALEAAVHAELEDVDLVADYATLVDAATFRPSETLDRRSVLAAAVSVGPVRLIDNVRLTPDA